MNQIKPRCFRFRYFYFQIWKGIRINVMNTGVSVSSLTNITCLSYFKSSLYSSHITASCCSECGVCRCSAFLYTCIRGAFVCKGFVLLVVYSCAVRLLRQLAFLVQHHC